MALPRITDFDEFVREYEMRREDDCLIWPWKVSKSGHGMVKRGGEKFYVHRRLYEMRDGKPLGDLLLVRRVEICENSRCCEPAHWMPVPKSRHATIVAKQGRLSHGPAHAAKCTVGRRKGRHLKLSLEAARAIRADARPSKALAAEYGVTTSSINRIRSGRDWREASPFQMFGAR
jgi:hypothetical protein